MQTFSRFYPAILSAIALLGCVLPFGSEASIGDGASLLDFPSSMSQAGQLSSIVNLSEAQASNGAAPLLAKLVYIIPLLAVVVIALNFRGEVPRTLQMFTSIAWLLGLFFVPYFALHTLINSNPLLRGLVDISGGMQLSGSFGLGGWLIFLAAIGLFLGSVGLLGSPPQRALSPSPHPIPREAPPVEAAVPPHRESSSYYSVFPSRALRKARKVSSLT